MRNNPLTFVVATGCLIAALLASGCKSPFGRTKDSDSGATGGVGGSGQFTVFSNELSSGGGAFEYPGGDNLSLAFDDHSNPISKRSIRFAWNGQPADGIPLSASKPAIFAGVSLMDVPLFANYDSTPGRDFRAAGYTKVTFYARGTLSTDTCLKIEAGGPMSACMTLSTSGTINECLVNGIATDPCNGSGPVRQLTGDWQQFSLPVTSAEQSAIKDFFKATYIFGTVAPGNFNPGQGGTLYLDQIFYKAS